MLSRYPQLPFSGRPMHPEQLWIYEITRQNVDASMLPAIHETMKIDEEGALPAFSIPASHRLSGNPDEQLGEAYASYLIIYLLRRRS